MKNTAKNFMFYVAFVASLGGLLFGFDTAVISGAEKSIQVVYDLSDSVSYTHLTLPTIYSV